MSSAQAHIECAGTVCEFRRGQCLPVTALGHLALRRYNPRGIIGSGELGGSSIEFLHGARARIQPSVPSRGVG